MKRAVAYIRRSTDRQDTSLADQLQAITKYAEKYGYEIIDIYKDDAISGTSVEGRDAFQRMIEAVERSNGTPPFEFILTWDVRRFSRGDSDEVGYFRHLLRQKGVEVIYITENLKGDDTDDLILGTKQWLARQESKDKSRDTIRGQLSRIQAGFSANSAHPYGYYRAIVNKEGEIVQVLKKGQKSRKSPEERVKLVPGDSGEIKVVRDIFDCYVNHGMGKAAIARKLNQGGILPPRGGKKKVGWGVFAIDFILKNQVYIGTLVYNKTTRGKFSSILKQADGTFTHRDRAKIEAGKLKRNSESEWMVVSNTHEPIISKELFAQAQQVRKERFLTGALKGRPSSEYLWTGLIKCEICDRSMSGHTSRFGSKRHYYYVCPGCVLIGNPKRPTPAKALNDYILNRIKQRLEAPERIAEICSALDTLLKENTDNREQRIESVRAKLDQNEEAVNRLLDTIEPRNKDLINGKLDVLRKERFDLQNELQQIEVKKPVIDSKALSLEISRGLGKFEEVFNHGTIAEKKLFVRSYVARITVHAPTHMIKVGFFRIPKIGTLPEYQSPKMINSGTTTKPRLIPVRGYWLN